MQTLKKTEVIIEPRKYTDLNKIYPSETIESENYRIKSSILSKDEVRMEQMRNFRTYWMVQGLQADFEYKTLVKISGEGQKGAMMSDTPMEKNTNLSFIANANGDVLIFGLGLGLVILPLLNCPAVKSITVIELYQDLIDVIVPYLKPHDVENKLNVVQGDCFKYHNFIPKDKKFDCIYGDIWISINQDNYDEMKQLTKNWKNKLNRSNPDCFIDHWMKDYLKNEIRKENNSCWRW